jgi:N-acetylmuramoyl-L-alanine amidase
MLDPAHGGLNYGFELDGGKLEKDLNLRMAFSITAYLERYVMTRDVDRDNPDGPAKKENVESVNPDLILGIHHHGKYAAFIEYNATGSTIAYQLAAYFASEEIPFKLIPYSSNVWLFVQPRPALVLIVNEEIENVMNFAFVAKVLQGLD